MFAVSSMGDRDMNMNTHISFTIMEQRSHICGKEMNKLSFRYLNKLQFD